MDDIGQQDHSRTLTRRHLALARLLMASGIGEDTPLPKGLVHHLQAQALQRHGVPARGMYRMLNTPRALVERHGPMKIVYFLAVNDKPAALGGWRALARSEIGEDATWTAPASDYSLLAKQINVDLTEARAAAVLHECDAFLQHYLIERAVPATQRPRRRTRL